MEVRTESCGDHIEDVLGMVWEDKVRQTIAELGGTMPEGVQVLGDVRKLVKQMPASGGETEE